MLPNIEYLEVNKDGVSATYVSFSANGIDTESSVCHCISSGWARVSNTKFVNMGQLGYREAFDPRLAIAYAQTGEVTDIKPSYVRNNVFLYGLSSQIGVFGATGIPIEGNVLHGFVGAGENT